MWLVFNVGCIECGVSSNVVGFFAHKHEADAIADKLNDIHSWRGGGQNSYEVFELGSVGEITEEYREVLNKIEEQK